MFIIFKVVGIFFVRIWIFSSYEEMRVGSYIYWFWWGWISDREIKVIVIWWWGFCLSFIGNEIVVKFCNMYKGGMKSLILVLCNNF